MFSSLLRPKQARRRVQYPPSSSPYVDQSSPLLARLQRFGARHATADFTETDADDSNSEDDDGQGVGEEGAEEEEDSEGGAEDEDGEEESHLLPLFSAAHLAIDALPVYNLTHAARLLVLPRTETTLTWEQLRSPQVSQFLVKPMLQQIRSSHFSRATLYALMANCLQFQKEGQVNPGNSGTSRTRAMVCELLALRLLKEYSTRELIDALSYDFYPLQGLPPPDQSRARRDVEPKNKAKPAAARISTLEVAIRASAKHFLAHPLVVQQLEAIWAGTVVFHSAADNLHRPQRQLQSQSQRPNNRQRLAPGRNIGYGTNTPRPQYSPDTKPSKQAVSARRSVTLYDPRDASLFKLSRLRVPRYRQFFSTCSLAILLGLFLAVLSQRSMEITPLEILFWFWSAGFMLDEVVGFNEQGFSLYILSFWNAFDLGILLLLIVYYSMRLYSLFVVNVGRTDWNDMAYDVLAANAVLLFPRLFSVLDHYRYFSQLLIAFRLMAIDLAAVFILILIACSGFFVAFAMSFGKNEYDAAEVAYKIFQILMGFTPAAWEAWSSYNLLGKALLVLFLFLCHFIIVTILITVLTNSFMAIVSNANEEHQFVFAVNTISMVKNDALFSYVAPSNIFAWILTPLRFYILRNTRKTPGRSETHHNVNNWMDHQGGAASPPQEQDHSIVSQLEMRRRARWESRRGISREISGTRSVASDPAELVSTGAFQDYLHQQQGELPDTENNIAGQSDADGDDELLTNDDDEGQTLDKRTNRSEASDSDRGNKSDEGYFQPPGEGRPRDNLSTSIASRREPFPEHIQPDIKPSPGKRRHHARNVSTNTILYNPVTHQHSSSTTPPKSRPMTAKHRSAANTGPHTPSGSGPPTTGQATPRHASGTKPRPIIAPRQQFQAASAFNVTSPLLVQFPSRQIRHRRSSLDVGMSDLGLDSTGAGMIPSSFATQLAMATGALKRNKSTEDTDGMMGRLLLARMKTLEESFADMVKEVREMRTAGNSSVGSNDDRHVRPEGKQREVKGRRGTALVRASSEVNIAALGQNSSRGKESGKVVEREDSPDGPVRLRALSKGGSF
ncbi:hypothetical protein OIDMADRAFT_199298 [Oidiodendron maius Zn]|uniref:Uncharacterized protein n=1 Tax=Oidiodendron maius (strain Zn) TaxID=913774 RepID=A0A0C3CMD6_OIDMZ|nr:hypothetical protein OIDMADRAFT_199298 [Oidiodendron maius Zn]